MSQIHKHPVPAAVAANALINADQYAALYQQSVDDPDAFWGEQGKIISVLQREKRGNNDGLTQDCHSSDASAPSDIT